MRRTAPIAALAALASVGAWAQPAAGPLAFEAASVKPSPPPDPSTQYVVSGVYGGPGTGDPARVEYRHLDLLNLLGRAYNLPPQQLAAPDWMSRETFEIAAKVPPGSTVEQVRLMLQNLLVERFKLQVHRETKEMTSYSLTVAKGGPKLNPHADAPPPAGAAIPRRDEPVRARFDAKGYPILPPGIGFGELNGKARAQLNNSDLAGLVRRLSRQLDAPVRDATGLDGKYDIALFWSTRPPGAEPDGDAGPDLYAALQEQLGLKLERKKGPVEILVIDRAQRAPTGN